MLQYKKDCEDDGNENKAGKTALATHRFEKNHVFDFNGVMILNFDKNLFKRELSEMIYIFLRDSINFRTDTNNLSCIYNHLLNKYKVHKNNIRDWKGEGKK